LHPATRVLEYRFTCTAKATILPVHLHFPLFILVTQSLKTACLFLISYNNVFIILPRRLPASVGVQKLKHRATTHENRITLPARKVQAEKVVARCVCASERGKSSTPVFADGLPAGVHPPRQFGQTGGQTNGAHNDFQHFERLIVSRKN
jgi:hypothetical protein